MLASTDFLAGLGSFTQGVTELLIALGGGIGFLIRSRRQSQRERSRAEEAAALAAKQARETLESKIDSQNKDIVQQYENRISELQRIIASLPATYESRIEDLKRRAQDEHEENVDLTNRLLRRNERDKDA